MVGKRRSSCVSGASETRSTRGPISDRHRKAAYKSGETRRGREGGDGLGGGEGIGGGRPPSYVAVPVAMLRVLWNGGASIGRRPRCAVPAPSAVSDSWSAPTGELLDSAAVIASQLLLVDEVIRAGKQMKKG